MSTHQGAAEHDPTRPEPEPTVLASDPDGATQLASDPDGATQLEADGPAATRPRAAAAPGGGDGGDGGGPAATLRAGRPTEYAEVSEIDRGGMGAILRATHADTGRAVAIKVMTPEMARSPVAAGRFMTEARVTAQLEHPNIVPVHEVARDQAGRPYFAMKLVHGDSLAGRLAAIARGRRDALPRLLGVFVKVCDAIAFAHSKGVIHRDLKPANVMIGAFGEVLVMDWGLARVAGAEDPRAGAVTAAPQTESPLLTQAGAVMGTPAYMPPEQARGETDRVGPASDIYALGAILYELLALEAPYAGLRLAAIMKRLRAGEAPDPPSAVGGTVWPVPAELEAIVLQAMAAEPGQRYPDVRALQADVEAYLDGRLVTAASYGWATRAWKWARRHPVAVGVLLAALLTGGLLVGAQRVAHARAVAAARADVAVADPSGALADTEAELTRRPAATGDDPPPEPSPERRLAIEALLARLRKVAAAQDRWHRLVPADRGPRTALSSTYGAMARLAQAGQNYALARFALAQVERLEVAPDIDQRLAGLAAATDRRRAFRSRRLDHHLRRAADGELQTGPAYQEALVELSRYRDDQTLRRLTAMLEQHTTALRTVTRDALMGAAAGATRWVRVAEAVDAAHRPGGAVVPSERRATARADVAALWARVRKRLVASDKDPRAVRVLLAGAQASALGRTAPGWEVRARLACDVLGHLDDARAIDTLAAVAWAEWDPHRAIPAARALARLATRHTVAGEQLLAAALPGRGETDHWDGDRTVWDAVGPFAPPSLARLAAARPRHGAEDDLRRGTVLLTQGRTDEALRAFDRALARDPDHVALRLGRAEAHRRLGDLPRALADLDRAVRLAPDALAPRLTRARVRSEAIDHAGAVEDARHAIRRGPREATAHHTLGVVLQASRDWPGAEAAFAEAIRLDPRFALALAARGQVRLDRGNTAGARADLDAALAVQPLAEAYASRALLRAAQGDDAGAAADYTRAIDQRPERAEWYYQRGIIWARGNQPVKAMADFDRCLALNQRSSDARLSRARLRMKSGDKRGALTDLDTLLRANPDFTKGLVLRAFLRVTLKDGAGAFADADRAIRLKTTDPVAYGLRGFVRMSRGQLNEALADFDRARSFKTQDANVLYMRGQCLGKLSRHREAVVAYREATALDPRHWRACFSLGVSLVRTGQRTEGRAAVRKALGLTPANRPQDRATIERYLRTLESRGS